MRYICHDKKFHFKFAFDTQTGAYVRTGILDENGKDTGVDPFMGSYPHLIDVGIMGHCIHGKTGLCAKAGIGCYQSGMLVEKPNMSVEDFRWIAEQCRHKSNQFALGGRGDPDQHEHFEELLQICRENDIVFFSYMVLEQGALSGKYDTQHPMPEGSDRAATYNPLLDKLEILNVAMQKLADKYHVAIAQIPVAWAIAKGTLPIIGVTKVSHVEDAAKAAGISLNADETAELEHIADSLELNVIRFWEKEMK